MTDLDLYAKIEPMIGFYDEYEELYKVYIKFLEDKKVKKILDIGCGNGNFLTHLKEYDASGIDISLQMVEICKSKALSVEHKEIDEVDEKYDLVVAIADVLNYMDIEKLKDFLSHVPKKLNSGGFFICDINTPYGFEEVASGVMVSEDESGFLSVEADFIDEELFTEFTFFEKENSCYKKHQWSIKQYAHQVSDIAQNLDMKFIEVIDIKLFSDEFPDKSLIVFKN